jgi:hypothetical protein
MQMADNREVTVTRADADRRNPENADTAAAHRKRPYDTRGWINRASAVGEERIAFAAAVAFIAAMLLGAL